MTCFISTTCVWKRSSVFYINDKQIYSNFKCGSSLVVQLHNYLCRVFHKLLPEIHRYTRLCNVQKIDRIFYFCNLVNTKGCNQLRENQKCIPYNPGQDHSLDSFDKSNYSFCHNYFSHTVHNQARGGQTCS